MVSPARKLALSYRQHLLIDAYGGSFSEQFRALRALGVDPRERVWLPEVRVTLRHP